MSFTDSFKYKVARESASFVGAVGAGWAVELTLMPFVKLALRDHPILKAIGYFGSGILGLAAFNFAQPYTSALIDEFAYAIDKPNANSIDDASENDISKNPQKENMKFDTEDEAKNAAEIIMQLFNSDELPGYIEKNVEDGSSSLIIDIADLINKYQEDK